MPKRLFADVPEDLAALGDESLADLLASYRETSGKLKQGEIDLAEHFGEDFDGDRDAEAMRQWQEAAETVREIRGVQKAREEALARFEEEAETLHSEFEDPADEKTEAEAAAEVEALAKAADDEDDPEDPDDDDPDPDDVEPKAEAAADTPDADVEQAEADVVKEAEAITASAPVRFPPVSRRNVVPATPLHDDPASRVTLVAAGGNGNARLVEGTRLDRLAYAEAIQRVAKSRGKVQKSRDGGREQILVASAKFDYPDEQKLFHGDPEGNAEKIANIGNYFLSQRSREVLMAAGGICAPPTPFYDLPGFGTTARPVRDFLPSFQADRGGVSIPGVSSVADLLSDGEAITIITAEDDALGGTFATKSCAAMDCAEWTDTFVAAIAS